MGNFFTGGDEQRSQPNRWLGRSCYRLTDLKFCNIYWSFIHIRTCCFCVIFAYPFYGQCRDCGVRGNFSGRFAGLSRYNAYPAQIFMGDVGSLALGSGLALMALMAKQELLLAVAGGLFVLETLSVIMQVFSYKLRNKRIFRMAPLHHHFELMGWQEAKITVRFGLVSGILCLVALMTLKMR